MEIKFTNTSYSSGGGGKSFNPKSLVKKLLIGALVVLLVIGAFSSFYTVDDKQQAVVTTFGKVTDVTDAGVHFKLPFGIQKVKTVDVHVFQKIELGYTTGKDNYITKTSESTMITGDYNIVNVDLVLANLV